MSSLSLSVLWVNVLWSDDASEERHKKNWREEKKNVWFIIWFVFILFSSLPSSETRTPVPIDLKINKNNGERLHRKILLYLEVKQTKFGAGEKFLGYQATKLSTRSREMKLLKSDVVCIGFHGHVMTATMANNCNNRTKRERERERREREEREREALCDLSWRPLRKVSQDLDFRHTCLFLYMCVCVVRILSFSSLSPVVTTFTHSCKLVHPNNQRGISK